MPFVCDRASAYSLRRLSTEAEVDQDPCDPCLSEPSIEPLKLTLRRLLLLGLSLLEEGVETPESELGAESDMRRS